VATHQGRTVFVAGAFPGERVQVEIEPTGKVLRGSLLEVLEPSPKRRASFCPVSDRCGGCDWIDLDEEAQRSARQEIVLSALEHLGGLPRDAVEVSPIRLSSRARGYRRRAVLHPSGGALAYFGRRSHERVPIDRCPALVPALEALPGELAAHLPKDVTEVHLLAEGDAVSVALLLSGPVRERHRRPLPIPSIQGVVLVPKEGPPELVGKPVLRTPAPLAPGRWLYARPDAFAQANAEGNAELVAAAMELLAPERQDRALELYCGNGNFTFALAARVATVVAVESARVSLELARRSAREAGLSSIRFVEGDSRKVCEGLSAEGTKFDVLLLDPPRAGAKGVGAWAAALGVRRVCYVACDPASLARDAAELRASGFRPERLTTVDMFPQTRHVEAVMSFRREPPAGTGGL
jgi:23S rRNA (uracil1939-C5)-methyltransferase